MTVKRQCRIKATQFLMTLVLSLAICLTAIAQEQSQYDRGTPPQHAAGVSSIGSYISADIGTVNLSNGALNFNLPLGNVGGRGFWMPLSLNYSSKLWSGRKGQVFDPDLGMVRVAWAVYGDAPEDLYSSVGAGWSIGAAPYLKVRGVGIGPVTNGPCTNFTWVLTKLTLVLPDKGEIELRDEAWKGAPASPQVFTGGCRVQDINRGNRWLATDGSGIVFISDVNNGVVNGNLSGVVVTSDGMRYHFTDPNPGNPAGSAYLNTTVPCDWVQDRNGNRITIQYPNGYTVRYIDQFGRVTTLRWDHPNDPLFDPQNPGVRLAMLVTLPGYNGQALYYKVKTGVMNQNYRAGINPNQPVYNGAYPTTPPGTLLFDASHEAGLERIDNKSVLTELILPDNRALVFKYNEYGEVAEVQLPTGGKVQYDYAGRAYDSINHKGLPAGNSLSAEVTAPGGGNVQAVDRAVVARRTLPNGSTVEGSWIYDYNADVVNGVTTGSTQVKCTSGSTVLLDQWHYFMGAQRFLTTIGGNVDGTGYSLWSTGLERRSEMRDNDGTTVLTASEQDWFRREVVQWATGYSPAQAIANDNRVEEERKIINSSVSKVRTFYDQYNNPIKVEEYDFDQTTLKRRTETTYKTTSSYIDDSRHLLRLPEQQSIFEGSSTTPIAQTTYEYDIYVNDGNNATLPAYPDFNSITGHNTGYNTSFIERGNPTRVGRMVSSGSFIYSYTRYDTLGNVVSTKDPRGNVVSISYTDDFGLGASPGFGTGGTNGPTYALPTLVTSPPPNPGEQAHTARSQYDFSTGLLTGFKDRNGIITQTHYDDPFNRPTLIRAALGVQNVESHTRMYYAPTSAHGISLASNDVLTAKDLASIDDASLRSWTKTDGFGRTVESWSKDPQGDVKVSTVYDGLGRVSQTSNPYRPSVPGELLLFTTTDYDLAGRVKMVTTPDNALVSTAYSGNTTTVTDQAGKLRRSIVDGLGRLVRVDEPNSAGSLGTVSAPVQATSYSYDVLDNLIRVSQATQNRYFMYDSLSRLIRAKNPEQDANPDLAVTDPLTGNGQWSMGYSYDANGNLQTKTDARRAATTYTYDALNRVKTRSYSGGPVQTPAVSYFYDGAGVANSKGRLTQVTSNVSSYSYDEYDEMGRVKKSKQVTLGTEYKMEYGYDLAGNMTFQKYPSNRKVTTTYDGAGRMSQVSVPAKAYVSSMSYTSHGAVKEAKLGNGLWEHTNFNSRLQPTQIGLGTAPTNSSLLQLDYAHGGSSNNGNLLSQTITAPGLNLTQSYIYDQLNRLKTATETLSGGQQWSQSYDYDRFGNRAVEPSSTIVPNPSLTPRSVANDFDAANNRVRIFGFGYDDAGNLRSDPVAGANAMVYDGENRQVSYTRGGATTSYEYDGDGRRVKRISNGVSTVFVYNVIGQLVAEYDNSGQGPAMPGGTSYLTSDHLGSTRVVTMSNQAVKARYDYLPFGEEIGAGVGPRTIGMGYSANDATRQKFTSKERDNESGLDYFLARYYSSAQGRFTSPDEFTGGPEELFDFAEDASANPTFYADLIDPQTLNKYQYCVNNPLLYVDPDGHQFAVPPKGAQNMPEAAKASAKAIARAASDAREKAQKFLGTDRESNIRRLEESGWSTENATAIADMAEMANDSVGAGSLPKGLRSTRLFSGVVKKLESELGQAVGKEVNVTINHAANRVMERVLTQGRELSGVTFKQIAKTLKGSKGEFFKDLDTGSYIAFRKGVAIAFTLSKDGKKIFIKTIERGRNVKAGDRFVPIDRPF